MEKKTMPLRHMLKRKVVTALSAAVSGWLALSPVAHAADTTRPPNILVIFGDDIGQTNISAYGQGVVGYQTPNIDRLAHEGMMFTDYYAENSSTAGRSSFITGQSPLRTGLSKVGVPGVPQGLQASDVTIAQALKPLGYATGQFGKNHLGDRNEYLPTVHGFDVFYGNLYHLNAEEEPERPYWPKADTPQGKAYAKYFMPRGVMDCKASDHDDPTVDARFGKVGRQVCTDTGPLSSKRMETIDDETTGRAIDFMKEQSKADKPFFVWMNTTRMHVFTHVRPEYKDKGGMAGNTYADGMWEHDQDVGKLLKSLDEMGIADNTIVVYTTDNGPNQFTWPDAATTPFRNEKDSNYEGAFRVPAMVRWPGHVKAGQVSNEIFSGMDWFPTLLAAAGDTSIKERLLKGASIGGQSFKNHLDGYNQLPYLEGKQAKSERKEFYYFDDDGVLVDMRYGDWKFVYCEQRAPGGFAVWNNPLTCLRVPKIFNLRMDPYERADVVSDQYYDWTTKNVYVLYGAIAETARFLDTFVAYPPAQTPASFTVDGIRAGVDAEIARNNARAKAMTKKSD
ncbi:sulfatase [Paraburkholderia hospita]|jgi:arylsulfatase|uniref:Sulfatase n=1 Tax=Paraburkholderia hospita TaxID=169430 RepID=A0ABP2PGB5_9BURK|nr:arylsulfatase [Paraburkholderia hospita]EIM96794.1 sulfatase [Paraburkholderia hospita]OUL74702.1 arylsulfatase [Paraburkholderia hospita]OUL82790.1 arylsulfatase [Paraburkholderia hospita]